MQNLFLNDSVKKTKYIYKYWTQTEVELLKKLYPTIKVKNLAPLFPHRNKDTIVAKAINLNLRSAKLWHDSENEILRKYFASSTKEILTKLIPDRTWISILAQGERLGLKRQTHTPKRFVNENYFERWSNNMAYILGFILADGCVIRGSYTGYSDSLKFGVQLLDINILIKIKNELRSKHTISITKNAAHLSISSQKIVNDLKKLGITYRKSLHETIPKVPGEFVKDYIRGVIDGDGGIRIDKKGYPSLTVCGGTKTVNFIRNYFLNKFNFYPKIHRTNLPSGQLCSIAYRCNSALKVISYLYSDSKLYLDRKYLMAQKCLDLSFKPHNYYKKLSSIIKKEKVK